MSYYTDRCERDPEYRARMLQMWRDRRANNPEQQRARNKRWRERLKAGEIELPEMDWAICERGGSEAQAQAHRRRGQKPCARCLRAETRARREREGRRRAS